MKKVIWFTEGDGTQAFRFVKAYRNKSLFKRESLQLSYFLHKLDIDDDQAERIINLIRQHYPSAEVGYDTVENFERTMGKYIYYAVCKYAPKGDFYCFNTGGTSHGEPEWTTDIEEAQLHYAHTSAEETAGSIAIKTGDSIIETTVFVNEENPLHAKEFVIICKSKKTGKSQFYSRTEGTRIRLVKTSDAAAKFHYNLVCDLFDELKVKNKAFFYTVMPYIPNVYCDNLEQLYKDKKIPVAIMMTTKLKLLGRERKGKD